jgi:hypothetical protein
VTLLIKWWIISGYELWAQACRLVYKKEERIWLKIPLFYDYAAGIENAGVPGVFEESVLYILKS